MILSTNRLVGALTYRTLVALNANPAFMSALANYYYSLNCLCDDKFHMHHLSLIHI